MHQPYYIPFIQIRHNCLLAYDLPIERNCNYKNLHDLTKEETYQGTVTEHTRKRIIKAVDILLQKSPTIRIYNPVVDGEHDFRINFITLTVSDLQNHTARECYDLLLKPFLRIMRNKWKVEDYIWKAELQERGQVHYHITTNKFIHYAEIEKEWNKLQKKAGWLNDFARRYGHFNPNSIDIHGVWKVKNLAGYLCKYIAKNVSKESKDAKLDAKVWDCSNSLKIDRYSCEFTSEMQDMVRDAAEHKEVEVNALSHCTIIRIDNPLKILGRVKLDEYNNHIYNVEH